MTTQQKSLVLILARDLASKLATPVFIVDTRGDLIYYNEAAEGVLGRPYTELGLTAEEWSTAFEPVDDEGQPIPLEELPLGVVLAKRVPAHRSFRIMGADGVDRSIAATALPLYARAEEFVGALAVFWETSGER